MCYICSVRFNTITQNGWKQDVSYHLKKCILNVGKLHLQCCFKCLTDLKKSLYQFIDEETKNNYDKEAETALEKLKSSDRNTEQLVNAWAKAYHEVCILVMSVSSLQISNNVEPTRQLAEK